MKRDLAYRLVVKKEDGGYLAIFPSLPGCHTWGKTFEEAVKHAEEALAVYMETLVANGDRIPEESSGDTTSLGIVVRAPVAA